MAKSEESIGSDWRASEERQVGVDANCETARSRSEAALFNAALSGPVRDAVGSRFVG